MSNIGLSYRDVKQVRMGIGAEDVNLNSLIPNLVEAQTYQRFHNEFSNRKTQNPVVSNKPSTIYTDNTDFQSVGEKKMYKQSAGQDPDYESMGDKRCGCGCLHIKEKYLTERYVGGKPNIPNFRPCPTIRFKSQRHI